nr:unnamed protein product [Callosobruchus chinensis]
MHPRNFFSHQGGHSSYIKNPRVSRAWNGLPGDVLVEPASVAYSSLVRTNFP